MNRNINMFGRTIPVWFLVATMVGAGSFAIAVQGGAVHQEDAPNIQTSSDVKIHLQDVDGKVITNVPVAASRAFSPLPVFFEEEDISLTVSGGTIGSQTQTSQKIVANLALDVSEDATLSFDVDNASEDAQIVIVKAGAPSQVILDLEGTASETTVHGLVGHNEWLTTVVTGTDLTYKLEISTTDAGMYPLVLELLRVG